MTAGNRTVGVKRLKPMAAIILFRNGLICAQGMKTDAFAVDVMMLH